MRFTFLLLFVAGVAFGQNPKRIYLFEDVALLDSSASDGYRDIVRLDDQTVRYTDYTRSGVRKADGFAKGIKPFVRHGRYTTYYTNQQKSAEGTYVDGDLNGEWATFHPNGQRRSLEMFSSPELVYGRAPRRVLRDYYDSTGRATVTAGTGTVTVWFPNGKVSYTGKYRQGQADSVWVGYWESGRLGYRDTYRNGQFEEGVSWDSTGRAYTYSETDVSVGYEGGLGKFYKTVLKTLRKLPASKQYDGRVICRFMIDTGGQVRNIRVIGSPDAGLTDSITRLIESTGGNWKPAVIRGQTTNSYINYPIVF